MEENRMEEAVIDTEFERVFAETYRQQYRRMVRWIQGMFSMSSQEAEDAVSHAFERVYDHRESVRPETIGGYVSRAAMHRAMDARKIQKRRNTFSLDFEVGKTNTLRENTKETLVTRIPDKKLSPLDVMLRREQQFIIRDTVEKLRPMHQAMLWNIDAADMSYEEVAEFTGAPLGTIRSRVSRARDAFRKAYDY